MGIDFNGLVNFGKQLAKNDGGVNPDVIEGDSIKVFQAEVEKVAKSEGVDVSELYSDANVNALMGVEVGKPVFGDEDLGDMFALAGVTPCNDEAVQSRVVSSVGTVEALADRGLDLEEIENVTSPLVAGYVYDAPKGSVNRISTLAETFSELPEDLLETAGQLAYYYADAA